jgi:ADP-ribose pyrophosphatase YjhB (NUDIX family)
VPSSDKSHNLLKPLASDAAQDAVAGIIVLEDGRYLMQLRDDIPGIFYPDHWGLFGGAIQKDEDFEEALLRELSEELSYEFVSLNYFTKMNFCFENLNGNKVVRMFFEIKISSELLNQFNLGEGQALAAMNAEEILLHKRVVPYDAFAIWMHFTRSNQQQ